MPLQNYLLTHLLKHPVCELHCGHITVQLTASITDQYVGFSESTYDAEFLHLMRGKEGGKMTSLPKISWLDQGQVERVVHLEKLPAFKGLVTTVESSEVRHCSICCCICLLVYSYSNYSEFMTSHILMCNGDAKKIMILLHFLCYFLLSMTYIRFYFDNNLDGTK